MPIMRSLSSAGNFSALNYQYFLPVVSSILPKYNQRYIVRDKSGVSEPVSVRLGQHQGFL